MGSNKLNNGFDNSADNIIKSYLNDIGKIELLSADQERKLGEKIIAGVQAEESLQTHPKDEKLQKIVFEGEAAQKSLISANLKLVVSIAKKYESVNITLLDLVQEGNIALIESAKKFDYRKGFKFSTFATNYITITMINYLKNNSSQIRLPQHVQNDISLIKKKEIELMQKHCRKVTIEEISEALKDKFTIEKINSLLAYSNAKIVSLEDMTYSSDSLSYNFHNDEEREYNEKIQVIKSVLDKLKNEERKIIEMSFGIDCDIKGAQEMSVILNKTIKHVKYVQSNALKKIKKYITETKPEDE